MLWPLWPAVTSGPFPTLPTVSRPGEEDTGITVSPPDSGLTVQWRRRGQTCQGPGATTQGPGVSGQDISSQTRFASWVSGKLLCSRENKNSSGRSISHALRGLPLENPIFEEAVREVIG